MNPPNTIASDTLVEAIARGIRSEINEGFDDAVGGAWSRDIAQAALTAITEAGFVVCPREPTEEMLDAGNATEMINVPDCDPPVELPDSWAIYRAMIRAINNGKAE